MGRYLVRRTLFMVLVLFIVSLLTFIIFVKLPAGDPARRAAGKALDARGRSRTRGGRSAWTEPVWVQYARFAKGLVPWPGLFLSEDVYYSYGNFIPVKEEIARRLPVSITLGVGAACIWLVLGIPIGILSAIRRNSFSSRSAMFLAIVGVSMPVFWLGQLLLYVFWFKLGIMPSSGLEIGASIWDSILQGKFILPWITVAVGYAAFYARMVRGNLIETMSDDYIRTARAKGMSGTPRDLQARVAWRPHPRGHDARSRSRDGDQRALHHGSAVRAPGCRSARRPLDRSQRLPHGHGCHRPGRAVHRHREPLSWTSPTRSWTRGSATRSRGQTGWFRSESAAMSK